MDLDSGIPYGTKLCIPELNVKFNRKIPLQVRFVAHGYPYSLIVAFDNRTYQARDKSCYGDVKTRSPNFSHVDICVRTEQDTYDHSVNGLVTIYV